MNAFMIIVLFIMIVIILALLFIVAMLLTKPKKEEEDFTFALNLMPQYADGHAYGIRVKSIQGKGERTHYVFSPRDYKANFKGKIEEQAINIARNRVKSFPKGTLSNDRHIDILCPPTAADFQQKFLETDIGKALALVTEIQNSVDTEVEMLKEGGLRKDEILKRIGAGEISKRHLQMVDEIQKDALKQSVLSKDSKPGFSAPIKPLGL